MLEQLEQEEIARLTEGGKVIPEIAPGDTVIVQVKVKEAGGEVVSAEGEDTGEWVLVDLGDMIVHVMQPSTRAYYNLEELWQATPAQRRKQQAEQAAGE